ncbi:MAG TPA: LysM peptidoglycan-binding domain-containing protein, partial [Jatrophihabitans sp.]|nr:LysM peptidoglycan-binding domain-containing protein [Jatrophihabitans sp.]
PSRLGGGIAGTLVLGAADDPFGQPAMTLSAELPADREADAAGGWIFRGELLAGVPLTARHLVGLFVSTPPTWLGSVAVSSLSASMDTGRQTWSFEGAIQLGFSVEILNTPLTIGAGAELELAKTTATGRPSGKVTGWVSVNRLYLEVRRDIGIEDPTWAIKVQFGELWVQGTTLWRGQGDRKHQAVTIQLGGVTLGGLLEYLVNLAAPTLGFRLDPPWDLLKRVELSRFALTIDPTEKSIDLTYAAQVDLGVGTVSKIGVHYELGAQRKVDLILEGTMLGKQYTGANALRWDVIDGSPPTVPGQGEKMLVVRYLGLGQRVRLADRPDTVPKAIEALTKDMRPAKPGANPIKGSAMVYDAASQWLVGLDLSVLGTVDVALIFSDPGLYGLSIGLRGERAGPLAGLRFEVLYKKLAGGIGMFRIELRLPDQFRRIELGAVSITLGIVVVEIYTNGNFLVDLGFPHGRNFDRSFSLSYFPFIGRGGFYLGVLNGTTSRRVPQITNGTFSPVLELGLGISVGVGKELAMGPFKGGAFVEVQVIFEGVFAWFNPSAAGVATALYYRGQGVAAIHGKVYAEVDFLVVKASVTLEAYAQASVIFEAYRPTLFALQVKVRAEAKLKILFITLSFSFQLQLDASITVGSVSPTPWAVASTGGPGGLRTITGTGLPVIRRNHRRLLAAQIADIDDLNFDWQPGLVLAKVTPAELRLLPEFSVAEPPIDWTLPGIGRVDDGDPEWRVAFLLFAKTGDAGPAATLIEMLLRWSLKAVPGAGELLTAGQLQALSDAMQTRAVAEDAFSLQNLTKLLDANVRLAISGDADSAEQAEVEAVAMPLPPFVTIKVGDELPSDLSKDHRIGPLYSYDAARYMADFSPVRDGAGAEPPDDPAKYQSFASSAFRDWFLMAAREAVRQAQLGLAGHTVPVGARSLDAVAAELPRDEIDYVVQPGDTIATVAGWLGAGLLELLALNPGLESQLAAATPGTVLPILVGVAGATLVLDNAAEPMLADGTVELTGLRIPVRPGDTLTTIARRLYGPDGSPQRLVTEADLADRRVLLAGATFAVPARIAPLPGLPTPLLAGIFYVRYYADTQAPETDWYAQAIAGHPENASVLDNLQPGQEIPAGSSLLVPTAANGTDTVRYTTVPGDTLLRIGAALSLAQDPEAYREPAWQTFRGRVTGADLPPMPALAIQSGETLRLLAARLVLPADSAIATLVDWLAGAPALIPLEILEPA